MRIVIIGAGFTGVQLAKNLINKKNIVTIIDNDEETTRHISNRLDCTVMQADGNNLKTLEEAGIAKADALVCVTNNDEVNMITCSLVDAVYPDILKIARVRNYSYYVNTAAATRTHAESFNGKHRPLYGIDYMIHPDVEAADAIVQAVKNGAVSNVLTFDDTNLQLTQMTINSNSKMCGQKLMNIRTLTDRKFLVAYIEENGKTSLPDGGTILNAGCSVGVLVSKEDTPALFELCGSKQASLKKIALIGAGRIGTIISEKLIQNNKSSIFQKIIYSHKVNTPQDFVIIDSDETLAKAASEHFPNARIYCADATDESFLQEEGITNFDLAICATHNHEMNMVLASYLESLGVGQTVSLVESSAFASIAKKLGVDVPVALRDTVVDSIMSHLRGDSVKEIHTVTTGDLEIIECEIPEDSKAIGKTLRESSDPGVFLVLMIKKSDSNSFVIPAADYVFNKDDHVILITLAEKNSKVLSYFGNTQN